MYHSSLVKSSWPYGWQSIMDPIEECIPYVVVSLGHSLLEESTWLYSWPYHYLSSQINMKSWENVYWVPQKHVHSLSRRETFYIMSSLFLKYTRVNLHKGFVRMSPFWSSMDMCWSFTSPFCSISRMKWYLVSMCFDLSWNSRFFEILKKLLLS